MTATRSAHATPAMPCAMVLPIESRDLHTLCMECCIETIVVCKGPLSIRRPRLEEDQAQPYGCLPRADLGLSGEGSALATRS
jgi:hypothetical protein